MQQRFMVEATAAADPCNMSSARSTDKDGGLYSCRHTAENFKGQGWDWILLHPAESGLLEGCAVRPRVMADGN